MVGRDRTKAVATGGVILTIHGQASVRIVMTIGRLNIGGAERRLLQLVQHFRDTKAGFDIHIYVISGRSGVLDNAFHAAGVNLHFGQPGPRGIWEFWRLCRRVRPDLVHVNSGSAAGFYLIGAIGAGIRRRYSHIRSCGPIASNFSKYRLVYEPLTSMLSTKIIGVSGAVFEGKNFSQQKAKVIYNGIDPDELAGIEDTAVPERFTLQGRNVTILGRLDRLKNIDHAVRAFAAAAHLSTEQDLLHVVGPEGDHPILELQNLARSLNIGERVLFHGATDQPLHYLHHSDLILLPSDYEGLPGVVLEALANGSPVVGSNINPVKEIADLLPGVRIIPVNDLQGWAQAIANPNMPKPETIRTAFWTEGPFTLARHAAAISALWRET